MTAPDAFRPSRYLAPRFWPTWLLLGLMWIVSRLPYRAQMALGRHLGRAMRVLGKRRARIARINLERCFPDLGEAERDRLVQAHFESLGMSAVETAMCWWLPHGRLRRLARVEGREHLDAALARGKGAILLSGHFTTLEIGATLLAIDVPLIAMYREHKNPLFDAVMKRSRERHAVKAVDRGDIRGTLRGLREGLPVWYAPDQDYGREHSVFVPFFGVPAATIVATSRLAAMSGAPVVPFFQERLADGSGYRLTLEPALEDFPGEDPVADARRINALIEDKIRPIPAQYLWSHRRFKTRPEGEPDFYRRDG